MECCFCHKFFARASLARHKKSHYEEPLPEVPRVGKEGKTRQITEERVQCYICLAFLRLRHLETHLLAHDSDEENVDISA